MKVPFPFKFVHSADLHLDSPFRIHKGRDDELRDLLLGASLAAFSRLCDLAIDEEVDFIVLAGDIYDGIERGARAQLEMRRQLLRLGSQGITVYMAFGNHDPIDSAERFAIDWPENLVIFPDLPETFSLERDGMKFGEITGVSYQTREEHRNLARLFPNSGTELFSIAVLHSNVGNSREHGNYAPASLPDLIEKGYDYWALGHIHKRTVLSESPLIIYPGNIQGLHMKPSERGPKGAELVAVSQSGITHSFMTLSEVLFDIVKVDVTGYRTLNSLIDGCIEGLEERRQRVGERPLVARIDLAGIVGEELEDLGANLDDVNNELVLATRDMRPAVFLDQLDGHFLKRGSLEDLVPLSDVVGELIKEIGEWRQDDGRLGQVTLDGDLRSMLVARLKRLGIGGSLAVKRADVDSAEILLSQLLSGGGLA